MSYQELKDLKKANVLHIDVRERWEIERDGKIPASVNHVRYSHCYLEMFADAVWLVSTEPRGLEETW